MLLLFQNCEPTAKAIKVLFHRPSIFGLVWEFFFEPLALPQHTGQAVTSPCHSIQVVLLCKSGIVESDVDVVVILSCHLSFVLKSQQVKFYFIEVCPFLCAVPSPLSIGFGDNGVDELKPCFVVPSEGQERVSPVAIGRFPVRVDLDRTREPLSRAALDVLLEIDVANK